MKRDAHFSFTRYDSFAILNNVFKLRESCRYDHNPHTPSNIENNTVRW